MSATTIDPQFAQLFNFTAADLHENQQGRLSDAQLEKMQQNQRGENSILFLLLPLFVIGVTIPLWGPLVGLEIDMEVDAGYLGFVALSLVMVGVFGYLWIRQQRKLAAAPVQQNRAVTQIMDYMTVEGDEEDGYVLVSPGRRIPINRAQYQVFKRLGPAFYDVYYAPHYRKVAAVLLTDQKSAANKSAELLREEYGLPHNVPARAAQLWDFTAEDLQANRNGELGENQKKKLGREIRIGAKQKVTDQPVQQLEGALYIERDEQNVVFAKIPKLWLRINGVGVQTLHRFIDLLEEELESGETYRLYYLHDPYQNNNRPLSIERV